MPTLYQNDAVAPQSEKCVSRRRLASLAQVGVVILVANLLPCLARAADFQVDYPFAVTADNKEVHVQNLSDDYLTLTLRIRGSNFHADFPCTVNVMVPAHRNNSVPLPVRAHDPAKPLDYQISVRGVPLKTPAQLRADAAHASPPPKPVLLKKGTQLQGFSCQSE